MSHLPAAATQWRAQWHGTSGQAIRYDRRYEKRREVDLARGYADELRHRRRIMFGIKTLLAGKVRGSGPCPLGRRGQAAAAW
jgi:hypothetical protein